jgi:CPA1 family monovalent cation:H+ antiporter
MAPERLRPLPLLSELSDEELATLAGWVEERRVSEGQRLTPEGASGYAFFLILEGTADVLQDGVLLRSLAAGDHFGELALIERAGRRTATVVATSPMVLGEVFGTGFRDLERTFPSLAARISATAAQRSGEPA